MAFAEDGWENLFIGREMAGKWEVFKSETARVQMQHVPERVKGKAGKFRKPGLTS